ncbi:MAG TPA: tRNA (adenosine(37)-N6)-dimethylallyltransferase MiaA, partial [Firmicutes bacterium]|nr:tRNA (adenosine(37)-N6)-dimethylallyltransferase MiaA [Bacillota bacterium]
MIYVILGTTASGKTDLALKLARRYNMPLIGCDAFQIYKELIKGSAVPSEDELEGIKHHLISDHSIKSPINIADYQRECRKILDEYLKLGQDVIMCGGSFLYAKSALFSYEFPKESSSESFDELDNDELYSMLIKLDPSSSEKIHKNNRKRVIRAIINAKNNNKRSQTNDKLIYPAKFFAIDIAKEENEQNIVLRTEKMFDNGFVDEVKELIKDEKNFTTALEAIGYKQIIEGLKNGDTEEEMKNLTIIKTRQYAKRQRTFLRHQFENINILKSEDIERLIDNHQMMKKRTELALGKEKYTKIINQNVLICGIGGVGATLCEALCRLGVMKITIIDFDVVSASNLNRQILYDVNDIGTNKVDAAKEKLLKINPLIEVNCIKQKIDSN